jgi:hypothetical protein
LPGNGDGGAQFLNEIRLQLVDFAVELFHDLNRKAGESVKLYGAENRQEEEMNE